MLNNKADFVLEYNEKANVQLKRDSIDWSQSKVIFIAHSFTPYQRDAISFKDLRFELWEVKKYDNNTYLYNQITAAKTSESINKVTSNDTVQNVSKEVKNYTVDDHFKPNWTESRELFDEIKDKILNLDDRIVESPQKYYIGYKIGNKIVVAIKGFKSFVDLELLRIEPQDIKDIENKLVYQKNSMKYYNKHISVLHIHNTDEIDYGIYLTKQLINKFFS